MQDEIRAVGATDTIAVLLPQAELIYLTDRRAHARLFIEHDVPVALATDYCSSIHATALPVTLAVVALAAFFIALGVGTVRRRVAMPKSATFDGQIVARRQERDSDSEGSEIVRCTVIDGGERAWIFGERHVYEGVAVDDLVKVTVSRAREIRKA